ncbi:UNVERIFIED_CONTAM: hypothetical protein PYX00_003123 [Menopon gallinae]|uniref:GDP-fucose protein O-fucosyltransferase 2 n=1 Tax=Menopon gallinae TaxID=328185 RepID=A0AAW2I072_9NEOP
MYGKIFLLFTLSNFVVANVDDDFCDVNEKGGECGSKGSSLNLRYIFYDVNPPEGFNLRRDVYMRMAGFIKKLNQDVNSYLVLPPWSHLYHWQSDDIKGQTRLPWSTFFDIETLQSYAPVIEMRDFFETGIKMIDQVYVLQHFEDTFTSGNFEDRMKIEPCLAKIRYRRAGDAYEGYFWDFRNVTSKKVDCLSYHGPAVKLADVLKMSEARTIMFDHAEVALHDRFGDKEYWDARKSMKFAQHLIEEAENYQTKYLNWKRELHANPWPNAVRNATGGPYLAAHVRRKDFLYGHKKTVPSLDGVAKHIDRACERLGLDTVFVATDAPKEEKRELIKKLPKRKVFMYDPSEEVRAKWKDGGIAIIEQIICSNARYFIGTHESTYSFTIREEREIMGFEPKTTFQRFCGDEEKNCEPPTRRLIVH